MLPAHSITGCAPATVVAAVTTLLIGLESALAALTVAVLMMTVLLLTESFTVVTSVMVADAPAGRAPNVTRRLLPEPRQSPLPLAEQETNVTEPGRLSTTITFSAVT